MIRGIELLGVCAFAIELAGSKSTIALSIRKTRRQDNNTTSAHPVAPKQ